MSNDRHDVKQLALNFETKVFDFRAAQEISSLVSAAPVAFGPLSLVVDNSLLVRQNEGHLEPNSPEITRLILDLGKKLSW